ncbi:MAG: hypothetical protein J7M24_02530 [Candidatus Latescibacteria bacterium]|nr:hypothetical protein [Candidatus Latescibacterota bacterium]
MKSQLAGNIGSVSLGAGYRFYGDRYHVDLMYGYVHERSGGITIHHITLKNTYRPWKWRINSRRTVVPLTVGLHFSYKIGNNNYETWLFLPDRYPDNYYYSTSFHILPSVGSSIIINRPSARLLKHAEIYYEIGSVDIYIHHLLREKRSMRFSDIINLALGLSFRF